MAWSKPSSSPSPPPSSPLPSPAQPLTPPPGMHQTEADEEDENVKQLQQCSVLYLSLQDCLAETNRDWKSCQPHVQALKACNERRKYGKDK
ncbi:hypothetical protein QJS04_geneDACA003346 [Acorus gramineus]|uniref:Uncharacterized protein n=1 Tax=Acorus gramineus TaxID=55184 RepID=A0AAV9BQA2_ACOGR|nr:hypothetical protein QJS04_geneDACA003346 [Acorus gramineus]